MRRGRATGFNTCFLLAPCCPQLPAFSTCRHLRRVLDSQAGHCEPAAHFPGPSAPTEICVVFACQERTGNTLFSNHSRAQYTTNSTRTPRMLYTVRSRIERQLCGEISFWPHLSPNNDYRQNTQALHALEDPAWLQSRGLKMNKQKKVFMVQMLKVVFIRIYFFSKAFGPLVLGSKSIVCQPKFKEQI